MDPVIEILKPIGPVIVLCATIYAIVSVAVKNKKKANISDSDWKMHRSEAKDLQKEMVEHRICITKLETKLDTALTFLRDSITDIKRNMGMHKKKPRPLDNE